MRRIASTTSTPTITNASDDSALSGCLITPSRMASQKQPSGMQDAGFQPSVMLFPLRIKQFSRFSASNQTISHQSPTRPEPEYRAMQSLRQRVQRNYATL